MFDNIHRLKARKPVLLEQQNYFASAVLLPLAEVDGQLQVFFEVRSQSLHRQPGEVCFPGGRVEEAELQCPQLAALRETVEELGVSQEKLELVGPLDLVVTPHGVLIYPYVGIIKTVQLRPNSQEVEQVFSVPVDYLLSNPPLVSFADIGVRYGPDFPFDKVPDIYPRGWHKRHTMPVYFYEFGEHLIWGFTARILTNFITICWPENELYKNFRPEG